MKAFIEKLLIATFSCLAIFLPAQKSFAELPAANPGALEMQVAFEKLDKVLRIFDLGEIEPHLKSLDRSDPEVLQEVYLILAYHEARLGYSTDFSEYFGLALSPYQSDAEFEKNSFFQTYEAILDYLIFTSLSSKEEKLNAAVRISNMKSQTSIQKFIKCQVFINQLIKENLNTSNDIFSSASERCAREDNLHYVPYLGAVALGQRRGDSTKKRIGDLEKLAEIFDNFEDPYARLEIGLALFSGGMGAGYGELSLTYASPFRKLIDEYELTNTITHFMSMLGSAGISGLWGSSTAYQNFQKEAQEIIDSQAEPQKFLESLSAENLGLALGYGVGEKRVSDILLHKWEEFQTKYHGDRFELADWWVAVSSLSVYLHNQDNKEKAIETVATFIELHDMETSSVRQYSISDEFSEATQTLMKEFNTKINQEVDNPRVVLPFIYLMHQALANMESFRDNDDIAQKHYELAWARMPPGLRQKSLESIDILGDLLEVYSDRGNQEKVLETASRIIEMMEDIIFDHDGPYTTQRFESSSSLRHPVMMALYELFFASGPLYDDNPKASDAVLSKAFKGVQVMRANRLTKLYKIKDRQAAVQEMKDLKKYTSLSQTLANKDITDGAVSFIDSKNLDRHYEFSNLQDLQFRIPADTAVIAAYDSDYATHFAYINHFWFDPVYAVVDKDELSKHMDLLIASVTNWSGEDQFNYRSASWLHSKIFNQDGPVDYNETLWGGIKNIVFLPSKTMFNLPISLLHNGKTLISLNDNEDEKYDPNGFLLDNYYVSYAVDFHDKMFGDSGDLFPSTAIHAPVTSSSFFALADPHLGNQGTSPLRGLSYVDKEQSVLDDFQFKDLPETLTEVTTAADFFDKSNVNILSGEMATKTNLLQTPAMGSDVLMFSTHGVSPGVVASYAGSGLLLSTPKVQVENFSFEDVLLTPDDVLGLSLDADIVILNACNSGLSDVANAPGLTGLAQSFLAAGSDAVMVSHWPISSATTVKLTKRMFEKIQQDPKTSFNRALTDAQLSIKADPKTQHPFYWAPYNIYGNF